MRAATKKKVSMLTPNQYAPARLRIALAYLAGTILLAAMAALAGLWLWHEQGLAASPPAGHWGGVVKPWGLDRYAAWGAPLAVVLTTLALLCLQWLWGRAGSKPRLWIDAVVSLAALVANLSVIGLWPRLPDGLLGLGLVVVLLVAVKAVLLIVYLRQTFFALGAADDSWRAWKTGAAIFVVTFGLLASLAPWVDQAVTTASDEVGYILRAHSLVRHGTSDVRQAVRQREYREFYWARWNQKLAHIGHHLRARLYPYLLTPAYALGGRLGILFCNALLFALLAVQVFLWLRECGLSRGWSASATGLALSTAPVFFMAQIAFPDIWGMLLFMVGLRLAGRASAKPLWSLLGLVLITLLLYYIKTRMSILGMGLLISAGWQILRPRRGGVVSWGLSLAAIAAVSAVFILVLEPGLALPWQLARWWQPVWAFVSGLALDQNYGALFFSPILILAIAGTPAALKRFPAPGAHLLLPALLYLIVLCYGNWPTWHGGFATPARYLAVLLPAAALLMIPSLQALARPWLRLIPWWLAAWGGVFLLAGNIMPHLRYSGPGEMNRLVRLAEINLHWDIHHLLPSAFMNGPAMAYWFAGMLLAAAALAWATLRDRPAPAEASLRWSAKEAACLALGLLLSAALVLGAARAFPPRILEAEMMAASVDRLWAPNNPLYLRGRVLLKGERLSGSVFFPGGPGRLRLVGLANAAGQVVVRLDGKPAGRAAFALGTVGKRIKGIGERTRGYFADARQEAWVDLPAMARGAHIITLSWDSCPARDCWLLLDYLELLPPAQ